MFWVQSKILYVAYHAFKFYLLRSAYSHGEKHLTLCFFFVIVLERITNCFINTVDDLK